MTSPPAGAAPHVRVVVLDDYQAVARRYGDWDRLPADVEVTVHHDHLDDQDALVDRLADAEVVCVMRERTPFPRALFERLPSLRLLVTTGMRNAAIDLDAARDHGVTVCGTEGAVHGTAELTWGLILAMARQLPAEERALREGRWQQHVGMQLHGRTLSVLGLGKLGSLVAGYGRAFGMEVLAWSQHLTPERAQAVGARHVDQRTLFARADVLTIHLKLSDRTRGLVGAEQLAWMSPHALLVNTSRAPIVDQQALLAALHDRRLGGAALDVYPREPVPADDPILAAPNTLLVPHIGFVTDAAYALYHGQTIEAIERWLAGDPVRVLT